MKKLGIYAVMALSVISVTTACVKTKTLQTNVGKVFGTYYSFKYKAAENYGERFDSLFALINNSLSTFAPQSVISRINSNDTTVTTDAYFDTVYGYSEYVNRATDGAFDITVAPLVNYWGFGYDPKSQSAERTQAQIDSIREFVGFDKISLRGGRLYKTDSRTKLDASAVAKGYACDVVAAFFDSLGVTDYLIDIGGEMVAKGKNSGGVAWRVGIVSPIEDSTQVSNDIEFVLPLKDCALATSGNYRQYYITKERKVSHTINPATGYPTDHKLLSASVLAPNCAIADAYATAFMVIGDTTRIKEIIKASKYDLEAYVILDDNGAHQMKHLTR